MSAKIETDVNDIAWFLILNTIMPIVRIHNGTINQHIIRYNIEYIICLFGEI